MPTELYLFHVLGATSELRAFIASSFRVTEED